jgi:hypothetical protein
MAGHRTGDRSPRSRFQVRRPFSPYRWFFGTLLSHSFTICLRTAPAAGAPGEVHEGQILKTNGDSSGAGHPNTLIDTHGLGETHGATVIVLGLMVLPMLNWD